MSGKSLIAIACLVVLNQSGFAKNGKTVLDDPAAMGNAVTAEPMMIGDETEMSAKVLAIDPVSRLVRLKSETGRAATIMVDRHIANFDALEVGDTVKAKFTRALAVSIRKDPDNDLRKKVEARARTQRVAEGKPGVRTMARKTVVANVFEMHPDSNQLVLRGTDGETVEYQVKDKQVFAGLDEGDQVVMSYVQASAIAIEPE